MSRKVGEKVVALFDIHDDPFERPHASLVAAKKFLKEYKPDRIIFGGDILEVASISYFVNKVPKLAEGRRYQDDINSGKKLLRGIIKHNPNAKYNFLIGNHEYRIERYLEHHPTMIGKMDLVEDLGLVSEFGMEVTPFNEVLTLGKLSFIHGWYYNKHHAAKTLDVFGDNIIYGHVHEHQVFTRNIRAERKPYTAMSVGCLNSCNPEWKRGFPTRFQNGLAVVDVEADGRFSAKHVFVIEGKLSYGGRVWTA